LVESQSAAPDFSRRPDDGVFFTLAKPYFFDSGGIVRFYPFAAPFFHVSFPSVLPDDLLLPQEVYRSPDFPFPPFLYETNTDFFPFI